jgi:predicted TPR repeat methyltransferase
LFSSFERATAQKDLYGVRLRMPPSKRFDERFDAAYFDRFYESRTTRVYGRAEVAHLARAVCDWIAWFGGDLRSVIDVGAGTGLWRDWFKKHKRGVRYVSTDVSAYACAKYGHEQRDIARWRADATFDLVVCQGVLPYLSDADCVAAIANLGAMARGFLYLEAITAKDLRDVCDQTRTDQAIRARTGAWYRRELGKRFVPVGCGMYYVKTGPLQFYELERG